MKVEARDLTQKDLDRTRDINLEKMKALKDKGFTADQLIERKKFTRVFIDKYYAGL